MAVGSMSPRPARILFESDACWFCEACLRVAGAVRSDLLRAADCIGPGVGGAPARAALRAAFPWDSFSTLAWPPRLRLQLGVSLHRFPQPHFEIFPADNLVVARIGEFVFQDLHAEQQFAALVVELARLLRDDAADQVGHLGDARGADVDVPGE